MGYAPCQRSGIAVPFYIHWVCLCLATKIPVIPNASEPANTHNTGRHQIKDSDSNAPKLSKRVENGSRVWAQAGTRK
ncbi:hypothetical protein BD779DRAFT_1522951 [Infundibulicybe gibba]|nr:hypothetical protein BD779DRAFT_1522951 [Infundibulicybe gibba]